MTKEDIVQEFEIEEPVVFLEPHDILYKGIVGIDDDKARLIYD